MFNTTLDRPGWGRRTRTSIGCGAAVAIIATTVLTGQAAQAAVIPIGTSGSGATTGSVLAGVGATSRSLLGSGNGPLVGVGTGIGGGITVGVGGGLATVTIGGGTTVTGGTGTTTTGTTTPGSTTSGSTTGSSTTGSTTTGGAKTTGGSTTTGGATSTGGANSSSGSTTSAPASDGTGTAGGSGTTAMVPAVTGITLAPAFATLYPKKDGYRDSVKVLIDGATNTGAVTAITGTAKISRGTKVVKSFALTKSTQTISWNGRVGKALKSGTYVLRVVERAAGGTVRKASTNLTVSAKGLVKRTAKVSTTLSASARHNTMPAVARKGYALGKVFVKVTTVVTRISPSERGKARLVFVNGGHKAYAPMVVGTLTSPKLSVPNKKSFRTVRIARDWKRGTVALKSIRIDWTYLVLK